MAKVVTRTDLLWGYAAQALNMGAGLLLLPVILRNMSSEDTALWFVFVALAGFAQVLEFGFLPTLTRNAAYVYSGARGLSVDERPPEIDPAGRVDAQLLTDLVDTSRRIYRRIALFAAVVLLGGGTAYVATLLTPTQDRVESLCAWGAFAAGQVANFYFSYLGGLIQGRGDVRLTAKVTIWSRGGLVVLGTLSTIAGGGLLGLGLASLAATGLGRVLALHYFASAEERERERAWKPSHGGNVLARVLWHNARRLGVVNLGAFLIQRGNVLVGSTYLGLKASASYSLTATLMMTLVGIGMVVCNLSMPYMSSLQARREHELLKDAYASALAAALAVFASGAVFLLVAGNAALRLLGAHTLLLDGWPLAVMALVYLLELHHSVAANFITTTNTIPFVKAAIVSGSATLVLSLVLVPHYGLWALVASQAVVQLAYNNWKWPLMVSRLLHADPAALVARGLLLMLRRRDASAA